MIDLQHDGIRISIAIKNGEDEFTISEYINPFQILQCDGEKELKELLRNSADKMIIDIVENHYEDN